LSIPNAESVTLTLTVVHEDVDTVAHEDVNTQAVPDATLYSASGFVTDRWSIAECNDQRIAYEDHDSRLYRGCAA
jgi:hypothetical protein